MKVWILRPLKGLSDDDDPWEPWYDKAFGFVVRAETEEEARKFADKKAGDENFSESPHTSNPWLDPKFTTCTYLSNDGEPGVVMRDFSKA